MAKAGGTTNPVTTQALFDEWYNNYNATIYSTDAVVSGLTSIAEATTFGLFNTGSNDNENNSWTAETRKIDFEKGIAPLIRKGIDNDTLIVIKDFESKIPVRADDGINPLPQEEFDRRVNKFKDLLREAFAEGAMDDEMTGVWGDSYADDSVFQSNNLVGIGSDGAEDSISDIVAAGVVSALNPSDVGLESFGFFCGVTRDSSGNINGSTGKFDTTYEFPLLRDFINYHVEIFANREVSGWEKFKENLLGPYRLPWMDRDYEGVEEKVENAAVSGSLAGLDAAIQGQGAPSDLSEGKTNAELRQCALMSLIFDDRYDLQQLASLSSTFDNDVAQSIDQGPGLPPIDTQATQFLRSYWKGGRIIPLKMDQSKSIEQIANYFYSDTYIKDFFSQDVDANTFEKYLYYVYEDKDGKIKETKLTTSTVQESALNQDEIESIYTKIQNSNNGISPLSPAEIANLQSDLQNILRKDFDKENLTSAAGAFFKYFRLENVTVNYNGTNPSTARNDIKVNMKFQLETYSALEADMSDKIFPKGYETSGRIIKLRDLVTAPIDDDGSGSVISALKNTYDPSRNRIRLKLVPQPWKKRHEVDNNNNTRKPLNEPYEIIEQPPVILDLATVNHTLTRNAESSAVTFEIEYRGYMQSLMQMPFADILVNDSVRNNRKKRAQNIKKIIDKGCSQQTLRELLRVERNTSEEESKDVFKTIMMDLSINSLKSIEFTHNNYSSILRDLPKAGKEKFIKKIAIGSSWFSPEFSAGLGAIGTGFEANIQQQLAATAKEGTVPTLVDYKINQNSITNFVLLGDLILSVSRNLYKDSVTDETVEQLKNKLRFVICPIDIPDPQSQQGFRRINPVEIPVELFFFAEWFHEVVVKKDLKFYPISAFIRDLIERLVNNLLFEVCLSTLLPDEKPPTLRVGYFSSNSKSAAYQGWDLKVVQEDLYGDVIDNSTQPHANSLVYGGNFNYGYLELKDFEYPLFKNDINTDRNSEVFQTDYIVIYSNLPPYKREMNSASKNIELRDLPEVPTLVHGVFCKSNVSMIDSTSLSKTDSPFLREARYFNNNFGSLALMNTVYDLSFDINDDSANTYLYPGMLINVIIADFAPSAIDCANYKGTDNDPHKLIPNDPAGTPAHYLGIGGYFIIKSVTYNLGISNKKFGVKVECKFLGTEADSIVKKPKDEIRDIIASDKKECLDAYNEAVKINQATIDTYNKNRSSEEEEKQKQFTPISPNPTSGTNNNSGAPQATTTPQTPPTPSVIDETAWKALQESVYVKESVGIKLLDNVNKNNNDNNLGNDDTGTLYVKFFQEFPDPNNQGNTIRYELLVAYEVKVNGKDIEYSQKVINSVPNGIIPREIEAVRSQ